MPLAIMLGLSPVASVTPGGSSGTTFYILAENGNALSAENGLILRTEQS